MKKTKRIPAEFQPEKCRLHCISKYAVRVGLSPARVYQLFQEGKLDIVDVDGKQFVQTPLN